MRGSRLLDKSAVSLLALMIAFSAGALQAKPAEYLEESAYAERAKRRLQSRTPLRYQTHEAALPALSSFPVEGSLGEVEMPKVVVEESVIDTPPVFAAPEGFMPIPLPDLVLPEKPEMAGKSDNSSGDVDLIETPEEVIQRIVSPDVTESDDVEQVSNEGEELTEDQSLELPEMPSALPDAELPAVASETGIEKITKEIEKEQPKPSTEIPVASEPVMLQEVEEAVAETLEQADDVPNEEIAEAPAPVPRKIRSEVIMQKLDGVEPAIAEAQIIVPELPVSTAEKTVPIEDEKPAEVVVAEAEAVALSPTTKKLIAKFPQGVNKPAPLEEKEKVGIRRATVPDLELTEPEITKHEALGISIEVKRPSLSANDYLMMAYDAVEALNFPLAASYYEAILDVYPENEDAMLGMATVSHKMNDLQAAREYYKALLIRSPNNTDVLNNFLVLVSEESPKKALVELKDLYQKNPHYDVLPAQIAALYAGQKKLEEAMQYIAKAIQLAPRKVIYRYNLAVILDHAGYRREAIQAYRLVQQKIAKFKHHEIDPYYLQERLTFLLSNAISG